VSAEPPAATGRREVLALLLILILAAALRVPRLSTNPPGLIPDEAMFTYDAWSILKTGRDQYGERLPLFPRSAARLHSLYLYATVPSVAALGLTELGARVPSVLAGLLSVALLSRLVRRSAGVAAGLLASGLLAISPWHVLISRTGHEWCFLPTVTLVTVLLVLRALEGRGSWLLAGLAAGACLYTYTPIRMSLPLVLLGVALSFRRELWRQRRAVAAGVVVACLVALPVVVSALGPEGLKRLSAVSEKREGGSAVSGYVTRYAASFSPAFFLRGASEPELHRLRSTGLLYGFEAALLGIGILAVLRRRDPVGLCLLFWWAAAPLAVAVHRDCPDPILLVTQLPMPQALAGIGAAFLGGLLSRRPALRLAAAAAGALLVALPAARMARDLYAEFPVYAAPAWSHGVREAVQRAEALRGGFTDVVVEGRQKFIFSLILFYSRMDPAARQREVAGLEGLAYRARVGPYRIGSVTELARAPGRHLVWSGRGDAREAFPGLQPLHVVRWPDGRNNIALLAVDGP
jgi:4-amino-4-deoxy-L-arabinose transferase-like glycosyltransferase